VYQNDRKQYKLFVTQYEVDDDTAEQRVMDSGIERENEELSLTV
jgi:hypothetical protein